MPAFLAHADRRLPRGIAHLCIQFVIWTAFYFAYNITRGLADRNVSAAFEHGEWIARTEDRIGMLFEPTLQQGLDASSFLTTLTSYTYWLSQFVIVGGMLFWVYFRHHDHFAPLRNWMIVANMTGLVFYVLLPTAPPRMLSEWGFTDTLAQSASIDHETVGRLANQYAAMPSLHAMDAFIVAAVMFSIVRSPLSKALWLLWPAWVAFAVMATGNHYWLDIAVGIVIAILAAIAMLRAHYVVDLFFLRDRPRTELSSAPLSPRSSDALGARPGLAGRSVPRKPGSRATRPTRYEARRTSRRA